MVIVISGCFVGSGNEESRWTALIDETFLRMVDVLMPWLSVPIRKCDTVLEEAGRAAKEFFSQKRMNSNMSAL